MRPKSDLKLPWWTWIFSFFLAFIAKLVTFHLTYYDGFFYIYGSFVFCLPLYFMWGPRVFWGQFLAEALTSDIVGIRGWDTVALHALANSAKPLLGYYVYLWMGGFKRTEKIDRDLTFMMGTLLIGTVVGNYCLVGLRVGVGDIPTGQFLIRILKQVLRDCTWGYLVSYQLLNRLGPKLQLRGLSRWPNVSLRDSLVAEKERSSA